MSVVVKRLDGTIKMPLIGTEVGIGTGHIVLMGTQLPRPKKNKRDTTALRNFRPVSTVAKRPDGLRCHLVRR